MMTQLVLPVALFGVMVGVGLSLQADAFRRVLQQPLLILLGVLLQLVCLPVLAALIVPLFALPAALAAGLMVVALAPGGATSNLITLLVRGDTALSVSLTALTSLITPFSLPVLTLCWVLPSVGESAMAAFPVQPVLLKLLLIALLPVVLGMWIRACFPTASERLAVPVKVLALCFLLCVVVAMVLANQQQLVAVMEQVAPAALVLMLLAFGMACGGARMLGYRGAQALTLGVETGIQNAGTALLVTAGGLNDATMSMAVLCYGVVMNVPVVALVIVRNLPGRRGARA